MTITAKQEAAYLADPYHCPLCNGKELNVGDPEVQENFVFLDIVCQACEFSWADRYELMGIDISDE
jgi:transcription elongation factor Elf1